MGCPYVVRDMDSCDKARCNMYSISERKDGKEWAYWPVCSSENCPLIHPELMDGAVVPVDVCI